MRPVLHYASSSLNYEKKNTVPISPLTPFASYAFV